MGQISQYFRRTRGMFLHYCEPCDQMHPLPDTWKFNGDFQFPTFEPSFVQHIAPPANGQPARVCHYILKDGVIQYQGDCWHPKRGHYVPLPVLPKEFQDFDTQADIKAAE